MGSTNKYQRRKARKETAGSELHSRFSDAASEGGLTRILGGGKLRATSLDQRPRDSPGCVFGLHSPHKPLTTPVVLEPSHNGGALHEWPVRDSPTVGGAARATCRRCKEGAGGEYIPLHLQQTCVLLALSDCPRPCRC
eukprot:1917568-Rhodomonas_salina.2